MGQTSVVTTLATDAAGAIPAACTSLPGSTAHGGDGLAQRTREALGLLERYRHVEPVAALCGLSLRPAAEGYLDGVAHGGSRANAAAPAVVRCARATAHLRTRLDLWSALLCRDVMGFLHTASQPGLRGPQALIERALGMVELVRTHASAGAGLPYGNILVEDLLSARAELERARGAQRAVASRLGSIAEQRTALERELSTFADVLVALLGRDHVDAQRAVRCRTA